MAHGSGATSKTCASCAEQDGKYNLYLDVTEAGSLKLAHPGKALSQLPETCALDVGDRGGVTLDEVGRHMNLTRQRIQQIEVRALLKLRMQEATWMDDE